MRPPRRYYNPSVRLMYKYTVSVIEGMRVSPIVSNYSCTGKPLMILRDSKNSEDQRVYKHKIWNNMTNERFARGWSLLAQPKYPTYKEATIEAHWRHYIMFIHHGCIRWYCYIIPSSLSSDHAYLWHRAICRLVIWFFLRSSSFAWFRRFLVPVYCRSVSCSICPEG